MQVKGRPSNGGSNGMRPLVTFWLASGTLSLVFFSLLHTTWVEGRMLLPLARVQMQIASWYGARSHAPVTVGVSCSGADVIALCLGTILAFPAPLWNRFTGVVLGVGLILFLNTLRIGTLWCLADSSEVFSALHLYVWPATLVLCVTGYVFWWMKQQRDKTNRPEGREAPRRFRWRFLSRAAFSLCIFAGAAPWILQSETVRRLAEWVADSGALILGLLGTEAEASGNLLLTTEGAFLVTQECVATPLIAVYVAAIWTMRWSWWARGLALASAVPLLAFLAVARVLVLALPPALVDSPLLLVHGFYQFLVVAIAVVLVASWREIASRLTHVALRAALALSLGLLAAVFGGSWYTRLLVEAADGFSSVAPHVLLELTTPGDVQGALLMLPAFQMGFFVALTVAGIHVASRYRILPGACLLALSQVCLLALLGELGAHMGFVPHALFIRAWAVIGPVLLFLLMVKRAPATMAQGPPATS